MAVGRGGFTSETLLPGHQRCGRTVPAIRNQGDSPLGSVTRDDFRPESDIDILIEFEPHAEMGFFEFIEIQDRFTALFGRPVDLVTKGMLSPYFRDQVLASREVVYDRSPFRNGVHGEIDGSGCSGKAV